MIDPAFLLLPLLVLPVVLLFRFVGCGPPLGLDEPPPKQPPDVQLEPGQAGQPAEKPKYAPSILAEPTVIAYWRLLEPPGSADAIDQKGFQNGFYKENQQLVPFPPPDADTPGSEGAPGVFTPGTSLIKSDATPSRLFNGAYVHVPFKQGLYTDEFTIEAWLKPQWGPNVTGFRHTLFDASGTYVLPPATEAALHGFLIFADANNFSQVALAPGGDVFPTGPAVALGNGVHLAVTVQNDANDPAGTGKIV